MTVAILAPHTGRRCKPTRASRARANWHVFGLHWSPSTRWRCRRKGIMAAGYRTPWGAWLSASSMIRYNAAIEADRDEAYAIRLQAHHDVPPAAAARVTADVLGAVLATATGPLPPAMQDEDGERPWEYETGQFTKLIAAMGQPPRTAGQF